MAQKLITPTKKPETPKTPAQIAVEYGQWAQGRTGLTQDQLIDVYTNLVGLTPTQRTDLAATYAAVTPAPTTATKPTQKPTPAPTKPVVSPELIIPRTPYPKWWKDSLNARISLVGPGSQVVATVTGNLKLYVATIVITVTGATQITISFGTAGTSGPIFLGGEGQPMGFVAAMGNSPAPCGSGPLTITATGDPLAPIDIGGWATCFVEQATT